MLEECDRIYFTEENRETASTCELTTKDFKSLANIVQAIHATGNILGLKCYLKESENRCFFGDYAYLHEICSDTLHAEDLAAKAQSEPEYLMFSFLVAIIMLEYHCVHSLKTYIDEAEMISQNMRLMETCHELLKSFESKSQEGFLFKLKCNRFLKFELGSELTIETAAGMLEDATLTMECIVRYYETPTSASAIKDILKKVKSKVLKAMEASELAHVDGLASLYSLQTKFYVLGWCFTYMMDKDKVNLPDDVVSEWWEVADLFFEFLQKKLKAIKEKKPTDYYAVATLYHIYLQAIRNGGSKDNVRYNELEMVCHKLNRAVDQCSWAPPCWVKDIKQELELLNDNVLPALRLLGPSSYEKFVLMPTRAPAAVGIQKAPEEHERVNLDAALANQHTKAKCATCGQTSKKLLKCGAVSRFGYITLLTSSQHGSSFFLSFFLFQCQLVWYCDRRCQKRGWKDHKKDCAKLHEAKEEVKRAKETLGLK